MDKNFLNKQAVNAVFDERKRFIIIGLTGRTGSGCSTVASLLNRSFDDLSPPLPKTVDFNDDEDRKYKIAYNFLKNNWDKFYHIQIRNLITTFVLEESFDSFANYISKIADDKIIAQKLTDQYKNEFKSLHSQRKRIQEITESPVNVPHDDETYHFYFVSIPDFTKKTKHILDALIPGLYTRVYQSLANNIRSSGEAYASVFVPNHIYRLSQRANKLIKILRKRSLSTKDRVLICLDAIRNPFEAYFFRERYSSFYLMSISTDNEERKRRLRSAFDLSDLQISNIDNKESPEKAKGHDYFISQNIPKCIQISDIHIFNPSDSGKLKELKRQLVRYIALIMHPGIITPSRSERCMQIAFNAKLNSGCISRQVGAVVADASYAVKAVGWNNVAAGQTPCSLRSAADLIKNEDDTAFSDYEKQNIGFRELVSKIYSAPIQNNSLNGRPLCFCFKDIQNSIDGEKNQVHTRALHAEENAFLQISKHGGVALEGGILFTTASPCELCSKKAYQLGIRKVYYIDPYPGIAEQQVLKAGLSRPQLTLFTGAIGRAYQQLFDPIMAYKEEVELLKGLQIPNIKSDLRAKIHELELTKKNLEKTLTEYKAMLNAQNEKSTPTKIQPAKSPAVRRRRPIKPKN